MAPPRLLAAAALAALSLALDNGVGRVPPMGYSNWYDTKCDVHEDRFLEAADALERTGLKSLGYRYINIDAGLFSGRDGNGNLVADARFMPRGVKALSDELHAKGFSFGMYTDRGNEQCGPSPGSLGREKQDAEQFAAWQIDYLKSDDCNATVDPKQGLDDFAAMTKALNATGRRIFYCICGCKGRVGWNGFGPPEMQVCPKRGPAIANSWRIASDDYTWQNVLLNANQNALLSAFASPGAINDPDMLIGTPFIKGGAPPPDACPNWQAWAKARHRHCPQLKGCPLFPAYSITSRQSRLQFSLWAMMAAPLILSANVRNLSAYDLQTWSNKEVIDIDQDSLVRQGVRLVGGNLSTTPTPAPTPTPVPLPPVPPSVHVKVIQNFNIVRGQCYMCHSASRCCADAAGKIPEHNVTLLVHGGASSLDACERLCYSHSNASATCHSFVWNSLNHDCFGRLDDIFDQHNQFYNASPGIISGHFNFSFDASSGPSGQEREPPMMVRLPDLGSVNVWGRNLSAGAIALLFVNSAPTPVSSSAANSTLTCGPSCFAGLGITDSTQRWSVRDVWAHSDLSEHVGLTYSVPAPGLGAEGVHMVRMTPVKQKQKQASMSATLGPVEVVRRSGIVNCGPAFPPQPPVPGTPHDLDIPDEPCRAWRTAGGADGDGGVVLLSTHTTARYDRGPSLEDLSSLRHDCVSVFNSTWDSDPSHFDDRTWLMSPWFPPSPPSATEGQGAAATAASTVYALGHMEFHGFSDVAHHGQCINQTSGAPFARSPEPQLCWYNAVVLLKSTNGGRTFTHALPPPAHLVAAAPYRYDSAGAPGIGYGDISNVLLHRDGFLYVFTNSRNDYKKMKKGHCLMRTKPTNMGDPRSWRGWGGSSFNVSFINPYTEAGPSADPSAHVCEPLDLPFGPHFIGWNDFFGKYIAAGQMHWNAVQPPGIAFVFALSDDLLAWSEPVFLRNSATKSSGVLEAYPALLDEVASEGRANIDRVGQNTSYLYYMHSYSCNLTNFRCRDIWRQRVGFAAA